MSSLASRIADFFMRPLLQVDIRSVVGDAIQENYDYIEDLQRQQLERGETSDGSPIRPFYKPQTIVFKKKKGQPTDRVTLKDKGGFYKGIKASRGANDQTEITSTDPKTPRLVEKYTARIFGLSVASKQQLGLRLRPTIQDNFNRQLRQ